jgi:hypothetical protein
MKYLSASLVSPTKDPQASHIFLLGMNIETQMKTRTKSREEEKN